MSHALTLSGACGFSSVVPVLMKALESKCQIIAIGHKHESLLLPLLIKYEIYYLRSM